MDTADWEAKYSAMKDILPLFKSRKLEEQALRAESGVLDATLARVRDAEGAVLAAVRRREAASGAEGFAEAQARLEQVQRHCHCCAAASGSCSHPTPLIARAPRAQGCEDACCDACMCMYACACRRQR